MPSATEKKEFNYDLFRKRVRLFDSDSIGERELAVSQALRQCAQHEPPLLFWEVTAAAFGGSSAAAMDELAEKVSHLQAVAAERERNATRLAASLAEARQAVERLTQENAMWESEICQLSDDGHGLAKLWALRPKPLTTAFGIAIAAEWLTAWLWAGSQTWVDAYFPLQWLHTLAIVLFLAWSVSLWKCAGIKRLLAKWAIWIAGWAATIGLLAYLHGGGLANELAFKQQILPVCWWGTRGVAVSGLDVRVVFFTLQWTLDLSLGLPITRALCAAAEWVHKTAQAANRK